ncbi:hypothetical protein EB796_000985 [Bugula neritina]|uniref:Uncharacterized protein n=1 Tax=Bugula neritina TaxID=10212 RepID=A0A7J7KRJ4_BUGNE|nr:hypothetical protein EB796_000985 [Bugula neritina]
MAIAPPLRNLTKLSPISGPMVESLLNDRFASERVHINYVMLDFNLHTRHNAEVSALRRHEGKIGIRPYLNESQ